MTHRFKRCILHIGAEKTGTTSLQAFLHANRAALLRHNYFVPTSLSPHSTIAGHEYLATYAMAASRVAEDLRVAVGVNSLDGIVAHRSTLASKLRQEINAQPLEADAVLLLSNEHCHSRLIDAAEVARLREFLHQFADSIDIVAYLRPQHELAISLYDQAMKGGYFDIPVLPQFTATAKRWVRPGFFDFAELLERWAGVFGRERVMVRIYDMAELHGHDIVRDFLHALAIPDEGLRFVRNVNVSMSAERQLALNAVNRLVRERGIAFSAADRAALVEDLQASSGGKSYRPARRAAQDFYWSYALSNERARAGFLPERTQLFAPDFSSYPDTDDGLSEVTALADTVLALHKTFKVAGSALMLQKRGPMPQNGGAR